jgi:8-oxo-dGTP pyrophosphatase MutT (NUDIX family)
VRNPHEVMIAVVRGQEVLLMHRSPGCGGYWHLVAGGIEDGETAAATARRELQEETGLDTPVRAFGWRYDYSIAEEPERIADFAPGTDRITVDVFVVEAPAAWEPELNWEHDEYRWCGPDEADRLLRWPEPRELAARLLR